MSLSANMKAALQGSDPGNYWLCRMSTPDRTRQVASMPFESAGSGFFKALVLDWDSIRYKPTDLGGTPNAVEAGITIDDTSRDWAQLVEGAYGDDVKGSSVVIFRAHPTLAEADWYTAFTGEIYDWEFAAPFKVNIKFRTSDRHFSRLAPKSVWLVRGSMFPAAAQDSVGKLLPLVYGVMDSRPYGNSGAIEGLRIGQGVYALAAGYLKTVDNVYINGTLKNSSSYTVDYPVLAGLQITRVTFATGPGGSAVVSADVTGYETVGDGSGTLIEDPIAQLAHLISNWVVGDYRSGSWLSTSSILDATSLAATYFSDRSASGSFYVSGQRRGYDLLADWLETHDARAWWTPNGTLAFAVEDPTETNLYVSDPWLKWNKHTLSQFKMRRDDRRLTTGLAGHYVYEPLSGEYKQVLEVRNPQSTGDEAPTSMNLPWSSVQ